MLYNRKRALTWKFTGFMMNSRPWTNPESNRESYICSSKFFSAFRMDCIQYKEKECLIKQEGFFLFIIFIAGCHLRIFPTWMIITSSGKAYEGKIHASSPLLEIYFFTDEYSSRNRSSILCPLTKGVIGMYLLIIMYMELSVA